jgi:hypothetical protein
MKHLFFLLAFVCAINAAKFKFSLTDDSYFGEEDEVETVFVVILVNNSIHT